MLRGKYRQYRNKKRYPNYKFKLVERSFCLNANFLSSHGFLQGGKGTKWEYSCETKKEYLGSAYLHYWDSQYENEWALHVDLTRLTNQKVIVRMPYKEHSLIGWRNWFLCPKCRRKVITLFVPVGKFELQCRICHKLVYLSQMRGKRRVGQTKYQTQREMYLVNKLLERCDNQNG